MALLKSAALASALAICVPVAALADPFVLTSSTFKDGGMLAVKNAGAVKTNPNCVGENISPPLSWNDPPAGTKSFAFVIYDKPSFLDDFRSKAALYPAENGCLLVFETRDIAAYRSYLASRAPRLRVTEMEEFFLGRRMAVIDNAGIASEIWELNKDLD